MVESVGWCMITGVDKGSREKIVCNTKNCKRLSVYGFYQTPGNTQEYARVEW